MNPDKIVVGEGVADLGLAQLIDDRDPWLQDFDGVCVIYGMIFRQPHLAEIAAADPLHRFIFVVQQGSWGDWERVVAMPAHGLVAPHHAAMTASAILPSQ